MLVATYFAASLQNGKGTTSGGKSSVSGEFEKGLLTLVSSDAPGLQVSGPSIIFFLLQTLELYVSITHFLTFFYVVLLFGGFNVFSFPLYSSWSSNDFNQLLVYLGV